jgi:hypothetical protein
VSSVDVQADGVTGQMVESYPRFRRRRRPCRDCPDDGGVGERLHALDHGVGIGTVADEIPEHQDGIAFAGRGQRGLQRLEIGVNVAQDQIAHIR